jgi:hypothetical protein
MIKDWLLVSGKDVAGLDFNYSIFEFILGFASFYIFLFQGCKG